MQMHSLSFDISHTLAGGLVLISFMMLYQDRLYSLLNVFAPACAGARPFPSLGRLLSKTHRISTSRQSSRLVFKAIVIPVALHRIVKQLGIHRDIESAVGIGPDHAGRDGRWSRSSMVLMPAGHPQRPTRLGARGSRLRAVGRAARASGDGDTP